MVRADPPLPIVIAPVFASSPILITPLPPSVVNVNPPEPTSTVTPPAAFEAVILTASATASPPLITTDPSVALNVKSPTEVVTFEATSPSMLKAPVVSTVIPAVPALTSIPPATFDAFNTMALAAA